LLLRELGCRDAAALPPPVLVADASEREAAQATLRAVGARGPYAVLAPGARYGPAKKWPPERFAATAARLRAQYGWTVLLAGEGTDATDTAAVRSLDPAAIDLAGRTSLAALVGLLAGARVVVANDSGTMHLAAALGRPVVGIFGSTSPVWTGPVGPFARSVVQPTWCAPCFARTCAQDFGCMLRLTPEHIFDTLATLLEAGAGPQEPA
jgi:heptosyltransferase-2